MIEVLLTGIHSSIQDLGRFGMQNTGIPIGGAMDQAAMQMANSLLNNHKHSAVLEMSFKGPKLLFHQSTTIALAGADMNAKLNEKPSTTLQQLKSKKTTSCSLVMPTKENELIWQLQEDLKTLKYSTVGVSIWELRQKQRSVKPN